MRLAVVENEQSEVAVNRDEDALFARCPLQEGLIPGIRIDFRRLAHVMALISQPESETLPGAAVNQELHPDTAIRSIRSWAITAWAYRRQACISACSKPG